VHEIFFHLVARFFPKLFRQIVGGGFANERLAATGRTVKQEALGRRMLEFLKELGVEQRQFDCVPDRLQRLVLSTDLFPGQFRDIVEIMFT
jgi:hypothetical protein